MNERGAHFSMIRTFALADWLTLGNAAAGVAAIFAVLRYLDRGNRTVLLLACALVLIAFVLDVFDGRVARWRQKSSLLGRELDSLADIISFGVAPAVIAYGVGMKGLWDQAILVYFVACGVSRLARFNVTAETLSAGGDKVKYFEGTPIPTSLLLVALLALAVWTGATGAALWFGAIEIGPGTLHPLVLMYAVSGSLMISRTVRIPKL